MQPRHVWLDFHSDLLIDQVFTLHYTSGRIRAGVIAKISRKIRSDKKRGGVCIEGFSTCLRVRSR